MNPNEQPPQTTPQQPDQNPANKILSDFQVNLPGKDLPVILRLIIFFTLAGGLSIVGSLFADIVRPHNEDLIYYFLRIIVGLGVIGTAYGLIEKQRWGIWLYGLIALIALFSNPFISLIPWAVVAYLITKRQLFNPSLPDYLLAQLIVKIKLLINRDN